MQFFKKKSRSVSLVESLQKRGILSSIIADEVKSYLSYNETPIEDLLKPYVDRATLLSIKAEEFDGRYVAIDLLSEAGKANPSTLRLLSPDQVRRHLSIILKLNDGSATVAMNNPTDEFHLQFLEEISGSRVGTRYVCLKADLEALMDQWDREHPAATPAPVKEKKEAPRMLEIVPVPETEQGRGKLDPKFLQEFSIGGDAGEGLRGLRPLVDHIIRKALIRGASDIHIEPSREGFRVRYRIDGILMEDVEIDHLIDEQERSRPVLNAMVNIIKNRSGESGKEMRLDEREKPQDGRIYIPEADMDLRVSVIPTLHGESIVIRIHYRNIGQLKLEDLGFEPDIFKKFRSCIEAPYGMVLVSGPTGSGKTTTLYSAMQLISSPKKKSLAIEDPIEYTIDGTVQAQTNRYKEFSFAEALRAFLRHDPDIIMVGEIRDAATADMAVEAALTGHMVLSSIHANDAASTIARLKDLGVDLRLITATMRGCLTQRLVRRVCSRCKKPQIFSTRFYAALEAHKITVNPKKLVQGTGCNHCNFTGYHGRVGTFEMLLMTQEIKEIILRDGSVDEITATAERQGMRTLMEDALLKVAEGVTTEEEVWRITLLNTQG